MTDNNKTKNNRNWRSVIIKASLILMPLIGGYFILNSVIETKSSNNVNAVKKTGNSNYKAIAEPPNLPARNVDMGVLFSIYPGMSAIQIDELLTESWARGQTYETFTQFREHSRRGNYVNISKDGYRFGKDQGPWPPVHENFNIFVFGGSLTFGYGVPDEHSYSSFLQGFLQKTDDKKVRIYNFGRGHYYSSQELILYETLIMKGFIPDMVIFVDGANDFQYANNKALFSNVFEQLTLNIMSPDGQNGKETGGTLDFKAVVERYVRNKKMIEAISDSFNVRTAFVWHPVSQYKYNLKYHAFKKFGHQATRWIPSAYHYTSVYLKDHPMGNNFIWCADIQEEINEPLYVDRYHYTAKLASMVATCIADGVLDRGLMLAD